MRRLFWILPLLTLALQFGCASGDLAESNSAEAAFKAAEEYDKDERYEEALTKYHEVKNKHPYSRYAVESELRIADIHYKRENFLEAQTAYQLFKDFHPKHSRIDYVTYRLAMSYYQQLPPTIDRDLTPAHKAIQFYDEVIHSFPTSSFIPESKEKRLSALKMLAEKEMYIAQYYYIRDIFDSAKTRFEGLLKKYPNLGFDEEASYKAGISAFKTGDVESGKKHMTKLLEQFPKGNYTRKAKNALEDYGHN